MKWILVVTALYGHGMEDKRYAVLYPSQVDCQKAIVAVKAENDRNENAHPPHWDFADCLPEELDFRIRVN